MPTKLVQTAVPLAVLLAVYAACVAGVVPLSPAAAGMLPYLPIWAVCCFGVRACGARTAPPARSSARPPQCYSLGLLGFKLITFGDADEAHAELMAVSGGRGGV